MLNKKYRLNKKDEFKKIYKRGRFIYGKLVSIKYFFFEDQNKKHQKFPKIAIIVSKKISNKASVRNKIKRQIGEIIYTLIKKLPENIGIIFFAKKIPVDFRILKEDIIDCLKKGRII